MIESVQIHSEIEIDWTILCLSEKTKEYLSEICKPNWKLVGVDDIEDPEYSLLKNIRPWREFCWTAASVTLNYLSRHTSSEFLGYIDADCFFFHSIDTLVHEIGNSSILIFRHNFSSDRIYSLKSSGEFNVGVILGKSDTFFSDCIRDWRNKVISECVLDPENRKCGDQTYLNDWPKLHSGVNISENKEACVGPWNLNNYRRFTKSKSLLDGKPLIFYHFHGLKFISLSTVYCICLSAPGYAIKTENYKSIYTHYIKVLIRTKRQNNFLNPRKYSLVSSLRTIKRNLDSFLFRVSIS